MRRLRICSLFCTILFFFSTFSAWGAQGKVRSVSEGANWEEEAVETAAALTEEELEKKLFCSSAILMEQSTGKVLYEMNADTQMPPASITKIMTMLLLMERLDSGEISLTDTVTAQEHACSMGGSQIWLEPGEQMTVDELLRATAIQSANDAAVALAEHIGGSEDGFVIMMNEKAAALGMNNTVFKNASGLDEEGHLTTARDIALMSKALLSYPKIIEYSTVWMDTLRNGETGLTNTNKLIKSYKGITGLKTGTTDGAGSCLSATAERDGMGLIAVVMGCPTSDERFSSARALLDYGFSHWQRVVPDSIADQLLPVPVEDGVDEQVDVEEGERPSIILSKGGSAIESKLTLSESLPAPVEAGTEAGIVELYLDGEKVGSYPIVAKEAVEEMTFSKALSLLFESLIQLS